DDRPEGPHYKAAFDAMNQLLQQGAVATAKDRNPVGVVLDRYMVKMQETSRLKPSTFRRRLKLFAPFVASHGDTTVADLTPQLVNDFLAAMRRPRTAGKRNVSWNHNTADLFLRCLS